MSRRRALALGVAAVATVLVALALWALPEVVRRVAEGQLTALLGRPTRIERVEMNLFTGRFAVAGTRVTEKDGPEVFVGVDRVDGRINRLALLRFDVRLTDLVVRAPRVRVVRTGFDRFNFSDLVDLLTNVDPAQKPSRFTITFDRVAVEDGAVSAEDRVVTPVANWSLQGIALEGRGISTDAGRAPGTLTLSARLGDAAIDVAQDVVKLAPVLLVGRIGISGFDVAQAVRYVPPDAPAFVETGRASLRLNMVWKREPGRIDTAYVNGDVAVDGLAVTQPGRPAPFLTARRAEARIASADLIAGNVVLERLALARLEANAVRDRLGRIDLVLSPEARRLGEEAAATLAAGALPERPGDAAADRVWRVRVERLEVTEATVAVEDRAVAPPRQWRLDDLAAEGHGLSTVAGDPPGRLAARARMVTSPIGGGPGALAGAAGLGFDLTVVREVTRPDAPIIAGRLSLEGLAWTRPGRAAPVLGVGRASVQITRADPIGREVALADVSVEGVDGAAVRRPDGTIDLVAGLQAAVIAAAPAAPQPAPAPAVAAGEADEGTAPWRVRVGQALLTARRLAVTDQTVTPARDFRVEAVSVSARGLSTEAADPPATLALAAQVTGPGADRPMSLRVDADRLRLLPVDAQARLRMAGLDLRTAAPFLPPALPAAPSGGLLEADLTLRFLEDHARALRADVDGRVGLADLAVAPSGGGAPLVTLPRLDVVVRRADFLAGAAEIASVELTGPHAVVTRDEAGRVDVLAMADQLAAAPPAAGATPGPPARVDPGTRPLLAALVRAFDRPWSVRLDRLALRDGRAEFDDRFVSPATRVGPSAIALDVSDFAWPMKSKAPFTLAMAMPGGGRTEAKGHLQLEPLDIQLATSTRDAPLEPYQAYFPFPARLSGRLNGDSLSEVQRGADGVLILASRGSALGEGLEARAPGAATPAARVDRFAIENLDFSWPNYAIVDRIAFVRPSASVEREQDGTMSLRALFTPVDRGDGIPATDAAGRDWTLLIRTDEHLGPGKPPREEGPLLETIVLDFEEIAIEDGYLRFLDRSTTPPLSQDLSKFHLSLKGLSNVLGRRPTSLAARGVVDGEGTLDLRGESSGIGERLRADLVGELKDFPLTTANPYAAQSTGWIVDRGRLTAKIHYRVEGDQLVAEHDLLLSDLKVAQARESDAVAQRIGLPLGLIVALLKDTGGDIDFTVPIKASVKDRTIDWEETYWSGLKQAIMKLVVGPFRAIGRALAGKGDGDAITQLAVDPVTFAAGSAVVAPAMETHLTRVGDFMRRSPYLTLSLKPVATSADVESLKDRELMARIQAFQRERQIEEFTAAVRAYLATRGLPSPPPRTVDEQLAVLRGAEPVPEGRVTELLDRRLAATRQALTATEGIPADRLTAAPPEVRRDAHDAGRVEFAFAAQ